MIAKAVSLPKHTRIRPELTEQISRRANAYVHISSADSEVSKLERSTVCVIKLVLQIRIAALGARDIERAERLVIRAAHEVCFPELVAYYSFDGTHRYIRHL